MLHQENHLKISLFPCLSDNYGFLVHDQINNFTASVDTPDANAILLELDDRNWKLTHILNTHHHWDHTGGNLELKEKTGCTIAGPAGEVNRIPGIDILLHDGDIFEFGNFRANIHETPGHTLGHIVYHFTDEHIAFVGDTLFAMGCGRLFEGTPEQMWQSLQIILEWPDNTKMFCAHEYTLKNGEFSLTIDPDNQDLIDRVEFVRQLRKEEKPTIPTSLLIEKKTNPFLRPGSREIRNTLKLQNATDTEVFSEIRKLRDVY